MKDKIPTKEDILAYLKTLNLKLGKIGIIELGLFGSYGSIVKALRPLKFCIK